MPTATLTERLDALESNLPAIPAASPPPPAHDRRCRLRPLPPPSSTTVAELDQVLPRHRPDVRQDRHRPGPRRRHRRARHRQHRRQDGRRPGPRRRQRRAEHGQHGRQDRGRPGHEGRRRRRHVDPHGARTVTGQSKAQGKKVSKAATVRATKVVDSAIDAIEDKPGTGTPYEQWTKAELVERAQELDIAGRSGLNKKQLITALRAA